MRSGRKLGAPTPSTRSSGGTDPLKRNGASSQLSAARASDGHKGAAVVRSSRPNTGGHDDPACGRRPAGVPARSQRRPAERSARPDRPLLRLRRCRHLLRAGQPELSRPPRARSQCRQGAGAGSYGMGTRQSGRTGGTGRTGDAGRQGRSDELPEAARRRRRRPDHPRGGSRAHEKPLRPHGYQRRRRHRRRRNAGDGRPPAPTSRWPSRSARWAHGIASKAESSVSFSDRDEPSRPWRRQSARRRWRATARRCPSDRSTRSRRSARSEPAAS